MSVPTRWAAPLLMPSSELTVISSWVSPWLNLVANMFVARVDSAFGS